MTYSIYSSTVEVIAINKNLKEWGGTLSQEEWRGPWYINFLPFSIISALLYWLLHKYSHIYFILNKILSPLHPFPFTANLLEKVVYTQYLYFLTCHKLLKPQRFRVPSPSYPASRPAREVPSHCLCGIKVSWGAVKFLRGIRKKNKGKLKRILKTILQRSVMTAGATGR